MSDDEGMTSTATDAGPEPTYSTYPPAYFAVDLETTGLQPGLDHILEIAWTALDLRFNQTQPLRRVVVHAGFAARHRLEQNDFVREMHAANGLLAATRNENAPHIADAVDEVLATMPVREDGKPLVLFGSSVHFDQAFLRERAPEIAARLHYRIADVSSMLAYATAAGIPWPPEEPIAHRAYDDIAWSIRTAQYLRDYVREPQEAAERIGARIDAWLADDAPEERHAGRGVCRGCVHDRDNPAFPLAGPEHTCGRTRERIQR